MRWLSGKHFVADARERINVAARADVFLRRRLFRRHVERGAERQARFGQAAASGRAHCERDAEVGHHRPAVGEENVLRLDVAMDDALFVRVVQCIGDVGGDLHRVVDADLRLAIELRTQRLAIDERHHVEQESVDFPAVEQRQNVRMLQRGCGRDLLQEALGAQHGGEFRLQHLHGDAALVLHVLGEIDRGHAALAERALNAVAVAEGRRQSHGDFGHHAIMPSRPALREPESAAWRGAHGGAIASPCMDPSDVIHCHT